MRFVLSTSVLLSWTLSAKSWAFQPTYQTGVSRRSFTSLTASAVDNEASKATSTAQETTNNEDNHCLTQEIISKLRYRELQAELSHRQLPTHGTTGQLRDRLREAAGLEIECIVNEDGMGDDCATNEVRILLSWVDVVVECGKLVF